MSGSIAFNNMLQIIHRLRLHFDHFARGINYGSKVPSTLPVIP